MSHDPETEPVTEPVTEPQTEPQTDSNAPTLAANEHAYPGDSDDSDDPDEVGEIQRALQGMPPAVSSVLSLPSAPSALAASAAPSGLSAASAASADAALIWIPLTDLRVDAGTQSRVQLFDEATVERYKDAMLAGDEFPAAIAFFDGATYFVADGHQRHEAARRAGRTALLCNVRQGTLRDAILFSRGANAKHGLQRSAADARFAIKSMLLDKEWQEWTDHTIADYCVVDPKTVGAVRHALELSGEIPHITTRRARRGGTVLTIDTTGISQANSERAQPPARWTDHPVGWQARDRSNLDDPRDQSTAADELDATDATDATDAVNQADLAYQVARATRATTVEIPSTSGNDLDDLQVPVGCQYETAEGAVGGETAETGEPEIPLLPEPFVAARWRLVRDNNVSGAEPCYWAVRPGLQVPAPGSGRPFRDVLATLERLEREERTFAAHAAGQAAQELEEPGDEPGQMVKPTPASSPSLSRPWPWWRAVYHPALTADAGGAGGADEPNDLIALGWALFRDVAHGTWWMQTAAGVRHWSWRDRVTPLAGTAEAAVADARAVEALEHLGWRLDGKNGAWYATRGLWVVSGASPSERTAEHTTWTAVAEEARQRERARRAEERAAHPTVRSDHVLAPSVLWAAEQVDPYHLPLLHRLVVQYHTERDGRVSTVRVTGPEGRDVSRPPDQLWVLPRERDWELAQVRYQSLQDALTQLASDLTALGSYAQRLQEAAQGTSQGWSQEWSKAGTQKQDKEQGKTGRAPLHQSWRAAPNPLCPWVISAPDPARGAQSARWFGRWNTPQVNRYRLLGHTEKMLKVVYEPVEPGEPDREPFDGRAFQMDHFICPTDDDWARIDNDRRAVAAAVEEWRALLKRLGTYEAAWLAGKSSVIGPAGPALPAPQQAIGTPDGANRATGTEHAGEVAHETPNVLGDLGIQPVPDAARAANYPDDPVERAELGELLPSDPSLINWQSHWIPCPERQLQGLLGDARRAAGWMLEISGEGQQVLATNVQRGLITPGAQTWPDLFVAIQLAEHVYATISQLVEATPLSLVLLIAAALKGGHRQDIEELYPLLEENPEGLRREATRLICKRTWSEQHGPQEAWVALLHEVGGLGW